MTVRFTSTRARTIAVTLVVLWIGVVLVGYYASHKPFPSAINPNRAVWDLLQHSLSPNVVARSLLDAHMNLGVAVWLSAIALGAGDLALNRLLGSPPVRLLDRCVFGAALGLGIISLSFFVLGATAGLRPIQGLLLLGFLSGVSLVGLRRFPWRAMLPLRSLRSHAADGLWLRALQVLLGLEFALSLLRALTPPVAWDSWVYHLTGPREFLQRGGFVQGIDIPHLYFPGMVEGVFTAALLVKGDIAAQLTHLVLAGLGVLAVYQFTVHRVNPAAGWLAVALVASAGSMATVAVQPYVEWGVMTFGFLAFWALDEALTRDDRRWLAVSGLLAGAAMASKYTAIGIVAPMGVFLAWRCAQRWRSRTAARTFPSPLHCALWGGLATAVVLPWLARNAVWTGNPVYPFLFGGWNWDGWKAQWFSRPGTGHITEPLRLLGVPWELTALATEGSPRFDVDAGPLFLALLPLAVLLPVRSGWSVCARWVVIGGYVVWLFGVAQSELLLQGRLLLPVLPFLAVLLAAAVERSWRLALPRLRLHVILPVVVVLVLALGVARMALAAVAEPAIPFLVGAEPRAAYLERRVGYHYRALDFIDTQLPAGTRVLFLWEPRSYLCEVDCQPDPLLYNWRYALYRAGNDIDRVFKHMRDDGYTHLLVFGGGMRFVAQGPIIEIDSLGIESLVRFETRYLERMYGPSVMDILATPFSDVVGKGYAVYRLRQQSLR